MLFSSSSSPHVLTDNNVARMMRQVLYALVPGIVACVVFFGWGVLVNIVVASATAMAAEAAVLAARRRPIAFHIKDGSALVTAVLLGVSLPQLAPWWLTFVATAFAIVIAKQLYGGLGYNPFNPAMIGYVVALISYPKQMTQWLFPRSGDHLSLMQTLSVQLAGHTPAGVNIDALTSATPLDTLRTQLGLNHTITEIWKSPVFGSIGGVGWEWVAGGFLLGGLWLLYKGVIRWHIPVSMLGALFIIAAIFNMIDGDTYASPLFELFSGGAMLGAFFIATDPITASTTNRGRLIYGAGIGVLIYIIRTFGGYPDGVAFAVLLMNTAVPTIDHYTQPKVFGEPSE